jgi:hypothetical protein
MGQFLGLLNAIFHRSEPMLPTIHCVCSSSVEEDRCKALAISLHIPVRREQGAIASGIPVAPLASLEMEIEFAGELVIHSVCPSSQRFKLL